MAIWSPADFVVVVGAWAGITTRVTVRCRRPRPRLRRRPRGNLARAGSWGRAGCCQSEVFGL